jgi:hypothetical protein
MIRYVRAGIGLLAAVALLALLACASLDGVRQKVQDDE